jgi:hypothetical protein
MACWHIAGVAGSPTTPATTTLGAITTTKAATLSTAVATAVADVRANTVLGYWAIGAGTIRSLISHSSRVQCLYLFSLGQGNACAQTYYQYSHRSQNSDADIEPLLVHLLPPLRF